MAYYSAVQRSSTQRTSTQTKGNAREQPSGNGGFVYIAPYQRYKQEEHQRQLIQKEKDELAIVEAELLAAQQKKADAEKQALAESNKRKAQRLANLEQKYLEEINRLLAVRAELIRRVRQSESMLILIIALRRRLRVGNGQILSAK